MVTQKGLVFSEMSGVQKSAAFLLAMGEAYATKVFREMTESEIKNIAAAMANIEKIPPDVFSALSEEFIEKYTGETSLVIGGETFVKNVIDNVLDEDKKREVLNDLEDRKRDVPFIWSRDINVNTLASYIKEEHPQTIAMILAHLPSEISAEVLMTIPEEKKGDISLRIAQIGQVPEEIVRDVDEALKAELINLGGAGGKIGGLQVLVDILNSVDKGTEDTVMELIEEEQAEMASDIRNMMFVFEDLVRIDDKAMREILKKVEGQQLTYALKTASEEMKDKIFSNLSQRASEMLSEDLEVMGPVRLAEVEEAQQGIVRAAKELEAEGTIVLGGKGKEDVLV